MDYIYAKFHQILTALLVDAYYGALHASLQDWVLKYHTHIHNLSRKKHPIFSEHTYI